MYFEPDYEDYGPSDELSAKIHELIETEAKARFTGVFAELDAEKRRNEGLTQELRKLRQQVRDQEQEMKKAQQVARIEGKREILHGFYPGEKVFYPKVTYHKETCKTCGGSHKVDARVGDDRLHTIKCPDCDYDGKRLIRKEYTPVEDKIRMIVAEINDRGGKFFKMYLHKEDRERRFDEDLFHSLEECQACCDEKNLPQATESTESPSPKGAAAEERRTP